MLIEPVSNLTSLCYSKLFKCEVLQAGSSTSLVFSYLSYCLCPEFDSFRGSAGPLPPFAALLIHVTLLHKMAVYIHAHSDWAYHYILSFVR
jgi:hypothetical protein